MDILIEGALPPANLLPVIQTQLPKMAPYFWAGLLRKKAEPVALPQVSQMSPSEYYQLFCHGFQDPSATQLAPLYLQQWEDSAHIHYQTPVKHLGAEYFILQLGQLSLGLHSAQLHFPQYKPNAPDCLSALHICIDYLHSTRNEHPFQVVACWPEQGALQLVSDFELTVSQDYCGELCALPSPQVLSYSDVGNWWRQTPKLSAYLQGLQIVLHQHNESVYNMALLYGGAYGNKLPTHRHYRRLVLPTLSAHQHDVNDWLWQWQEIDRHLADIETQFPQAQWVLSGSDRYIRLAPASFLWQTLQRLQHRVRPAYLHQQWSAWCQN